MKLKIVITCAVVLAFVFLWVLRHTDELKIEEVVEPKSEDVSVELDLKTDEQSLPAKSGASEILNKDIDDTKIQPIRITQVLKPGQNLTKKELRLVKISEIKKALKAGSTFVQSSPEHEPIRSVEEAFSLMHININMAYVPESYFEDDDFFYFSGGTTANRVTDFSTGFAVSKADRSITSW